MGRIVRLTESDLTRIVRRVMNEQMASAPEKTISLKSFTVTKPGGQPTGYFYNGQIEIKKPKCPTNSQNDCFSHPATLTPGTYNSTNFSGIIYLYGNDGKKYSCVNQTPTTTAINIKCNKM